MGKTIPVADPVEGTGGPTSPPLPIFRPKWSPKVRKKFFRRPGPRFSKGLDDAPTPLSQGLDLAVYPVFEDPSNGSNTRRAGSEPDIKALYYHELAKTITAALKKNPNICLSRLIVLWYF